MTNPSPELVAKNREVQWLLGRCLLRSQRAEKLLRSMVTHHHHFGTGEDVQIHSERRAVEVAKLGLGELVDLMLEDLVRISSRQEELDAVPAKKKPKNRPGKVARLALQQVQAAQAAHVTGKPWFTTTLTIETTEEDAKAFKQSLRDLVELRNRVVHHFSDEHRIGTVDECVRAAAFLVEADALLENHVETLAAWAKAVFEHTGAFAQLIQEQTMLELISAGKRDMPVQSESAPLKGKST